MLTLLRILGEPWRREKLCHALGLWASRAAGRPLVRPRSVTLTLTTRCNLRCGMCSHWCLSPGETMPFAEATRLLDQVAAWGVPVVDLSGGEPFVHPRIMDIIGYASSKDLALNITTNATLLTEGMMERLLAASNLSLQVSIDAPDAETHDAIRGTKGAFSRAMGAVAYLHRRRAELGVPLGLHMTTVIQRDNFTRLTEMVSFAKERGFDSITFQPVNDDNLDIRRVDPSNPLRVPQEGLDELDRQIDRLISLRAQGAPIGNSVRNLEGIKRYFRGDAEGGVRCYAGYVTAIISPDSKLWSCMGTAVDLKGMTPKDAWGSAAMAARRRAIRRCRTPCLYPCYLDGDADSLGGAVLNALM